MKYAIWRKGGEDGIKEIFVDEPDQVLAEKLEPRMAYIDTLVVPNGTMILIDRYNKNEFIVIRKDEDQEKLHEAFVLVLAEAYADLLDELIDDVDAEDATKH